MIEDEEPRRLRIFTAVNSTGDRCPLFHCGWRGDRAYMTSIGAAAYLADPKTGICEGTESMVGHQLQLCYSALRRLQALAKLRVPQ